jgi:hypothetical protein
MVCGVQLPVRLVDLSDHDDTGIWGLTKIERTLDAGEIQIHTGLSQTQAEQTLFHELCHAALTITGLSELLGDEREEAVVSGLEHVWQGMQAAGMLRGVGEGPRRQEASNTRKRRRGRKRTKTSIARRRG